MWRNVVTLSLLAVFFVFSPSHGSCSERVYQVSESELETLQNHLNALEQNNEMLKNILSESGQELTAALNALSESQTELTMLRQELKECKNEAEKARLSLEIANAELRSASESFKQFEKEANRVRKQRNLWEVLCAIAVGCAIAK